MDSTKTTYATFPFEWTVKTTSYQIHYRIAFNFDEIDEILYIKKDNKYTNSFSLDDLDYFFDDKKGKGKLSQQ